MLKRCFFIILITLTLSACQVDDPNSEAFDANPHRQQECDRILAQLGVSGDHVLEPGVATTPERSRLVSLYSTYGCDK